jgi:hypothetical protein
MPLIRRPVKSRIPIMIFCPQIRTMLNQHFDYSDMPVISSPVQRSLQITVFRKHIRASC